MKWLPVAAIGLSGLTAIEVAKAAVRQEIEERAQG
jgi:hypothetical protein